MRRKNTTSEMMKNYIIESFLLLLSENDYDAITIGAITTKAGVNRSTYYRHFSSKEDIICSYYENLIVTFIESYSKQSFMSLEDYLTELFSCMLESKKELLCIHRAGHSYLMLNVFNRYLVTDKFGTTTKSLIQSYYHAGGIFNCYQYWFDNGMNISPQKMAALSAAVFSENFMPLMLFKEK